MPALLTTEEAMAALRVSRVTFFKLKRQGYLIPVDVNPVLERQRRLLFRREDVERLGREGIRRPAEQRKAS